MNSDRSGSGSNLFDLDHLSSLVMSTVGTYPVRHNRRSTIGANRQAVHLKSIVGPPLTPS
jgi:hypothetical protein